MFRWHTTSRLEFRTAYSLWTKHSDCIHCLIHLLHNNSRTTRTVLTLERNCATLCSSISPLLSSLSFPLLYLVIVALMHCALYIVHSTDCIQCLIQLIDSDTIYNTSTTTSSRVLLQVPLSNSSL